MKDILNIMRFDFLTAKPMATGPMLFAVLLFGVLCMLFSPIIAAYITVAAMTFVIPLQGVADKSGFHKLYGILPVERKSITRARFLYIFLVHFVTELLELVLACISKCAGLYRLLPNQDGEMMQFVKNSFADTKLTLLMVFTVFAAFCLLFAYMEMMGQIKGRENEFKFVMIVIGILALLAFIFAILSSHDLIPPVSLPGLPETVGGMLLFGAAVNLLMLGVCLLFGEITAGRLAKREL